MLNLKNIILGLAIALLFAFTVGYGINAFHNPPKYEDFCKSGEFPRLAKVFDDRNCSEVSYLYDICYQDGLYPIASYDENGCVISVECSTCQKDYDSAEAFHSKTVFIAAGLIGVAALIVGAIISVTGPIGIGVMGGGLFSIIYSNMVYWRNLDNIMRFIILFLWLAIVVFLAYRINVRKK